MIQTNLSFNVPIDPINHPNCNQYGSDNDVAQHIVSFEHTIGLLNHNQTRYKGRNAARNLSDRRVDTVERPSVLRLWNRR